MIGKIKQIILAFSPFIIIFFFSRNILLRLVNPAWGDMVAIPPVQIPLSHLFYPWQDIYAGTFGGQYMPHFIFSQLVSVIPPTILQYTYLFFLFVVLFLSFLDFFKQVFKKKSFISSENLLISGILTLIIYFSNVFLVNFLQGNPDIYYPYLLSIPAILYLFLVVKNKDILSLLKMSLIITLATWFGSFAIYYMGLLMVPFFILFSISYAKEKIGKLSLLLILLTLFLFINNLPYLFMTFKTIFNAVGNLSSGSDLSVISVGEFFDLYKGINPLNLLYFAGNAGDISWILFNIPGGFIYKNNISYSLLSLQIISVIGGVAFFTRTKQTDRIPPLLLGLVGIFLFFFTLIIIWDTSFFVSLVKDLPSTALFRNPKKLILSLYVSFIILLVFLSLFIRAKRYIVILGLVLLCNILSVLPLVLDGFSGLRKAYEVTLQVYKRDSQKARDAFQPMMGYPVRYLTLRSQLNKIDGEDNESHYRVIVVPDNSQTLYQSHLRYIFNPFFVNPTQAVWGELDSPGDIMDYLYGNMIQRTTDISAVLKIANVKYIIVDRKSPYYLYTSDKKPYTRSYYGTFTTGDPEEFNKVLKKKLNLHLIISNKDFYVYRNSSFTESSLYIPQRVCPVRGIKEQGSQCDFFTENQEDFVVNSRNTFTITNVTYSNPTRYAFTLQAESAGVAPVFFSQSFDSFWKLIPLNTRSVVVKNHTIGNFFGNTWSVDIPEKGSYQFEVVYALQKPYSYLVLISVTSIIVNGILILYLSIRRKDTHL